MNQKTPDSSSSRVAIPHKSFELRRNFLYETIVGVLDGEGNPHLAPIGVRVVEWPGNGSCTFEARVFSTSKMYSSLKQRGECVIHFPSPFQLDFFFLPFHNVIAGLHDKLITSGSISPGRSVQSPVLLDIANYIESRVTWIGDEHVSDSISSSGSQTGLIGLFQMFSLEIVVKDPCARPINRQEGLLLEFLVKASRSNLYTRDSMKWHENISHMSEFLEKMEKVAPDDEKNLLARSLLDVLRGPS